MSQVHTPVKEFNLSFGQGLNSPGGGRLSAINIHVNIGRIFLDVLREHTAGDPVDEQIK